MQPDDDDENIPQLCFGASMIHRRKSARSIQLLLNYVCCFEHIKRSTLPRCNAILSLHLGVPLKSETSGGSPEFSWNFPDERSHRRSGSTSPSATNYSFSCGFFQFVNIWLKFHPPREFHFACARMSLSSLKRRHGRKMLLLIFDQFRERESGEHATVEEKS